jgi:hypothetical protein
VRPLAGTADASTRAPDALLEDAHELLLGRLAELGEP